MKNVILTFCILLGGMIPFNISAVDILTVESPAFSAGGEIPAKYSCDNENVSPEIRWKGVPITTKSLVLICDDPDAPMGMWIHWVVYNIPTKINKLAENYAKHPIKGIIEGMTDFKKPGWGGPCPPNGIHRYFFKLYAVNIPTNYRNGLTKQNILDSIKGHVVGESSFFGTYMRKK